MDVSETLVRRIAAEASADKRTVRKLLSGGPVHGIVRDRIVQACGVHRVKVPAEPPRRPPARDGRE